jgi:hypothetical protein
MWMKSGCVADADARPDHAVRADDDSIAQNGTVTDHNVRTDTDLAPVSSAPSDHRRRMNARRRHVTACEMRQQAHERRLRVGHDHPRASLRRRLGVLG